MKPKALNKKPIQTGNCHFRAGNFEQALIEYKKVRSSSADALRKIARFNISITQKRLESSAKGIGIQNESQQYYTKDLLIRLQKAYKTRDLDTLVSAFSDLAFQADVEYLMRRDCQDMIGRILQVVSNEGALDRFFSAVEVLRKRGIRFRAIDQTEGVRLLRKRDFDGADRVWREYLRLYGGRVRMKDYFIRLCARTKHSPFEECSINVTQRSQGLLPKVCVYTAVFGDYDKVSAPVAGYHNLDFVCFTDSELPVPGWKTVVVDTEEANALRSNRFYKLLPHRVLSDYDYSLYIDANILVVGNLQAVICSLLNANVSFAGFRHPERDDVYTEIEAILSSCRVQSTGILGQLKHFHSLSLPRNSGQIEACFLWRSHGDKEVRRLMQAWWDLFARFGERDQALLGSLMTAGHVRPKIISSRYGTTRENCFFVKVPHLHLLDVKSGGVVGSDLSGYKEPPSTRFEAGCRRRIAWVYARKHKNVASTLMRGKQLCELVKSRTEKIDVSYLEKDDAIDLAGWTIILTKGVLKDIGTDFIERLKKKGNRVFCDFVDDPVRVDCALSADGLIASSIRQLIFFKKNYPFAQICHVTHHVDPRLTARNTNERPFRIGYFGEIANAAFHEQLYKEVEFVGVNTKKSEANWVAAIDLYSVHYAVRKSRDIDGFKPFLKGFTSAHCKAPIITTACESDAFYYLTPDYPFLINEVSLESVKSCIAEVKAAFRSDKWHFACEIMESIRDRTSNKVVVDELLSVLD